MFRLKDLILLGVIFSSIMAGVLFPRFGAIFQPLPLYAMMTILFLSFLSIEVAAIWDIIKRATLVIVCLLFIRMILLPVSVTLLFRAIWPTFSLSALLLSGISTGVVAPFISTLVKANTPAVLVMVVASSLLVPFTLPPLVDLLFARSMEMSLFPMMRLLLVVIFIPMAGAELLRRVYAGAAEKLASRQYGISLFLFAVTNLGIFSKYSAFFYQEPLIVLSAAGVAFLLGAIYFLAGLLVSWGRDPEDQLAAVISFGITNNVLVIVFSSQFFTPLEPTVAAVYMIPFFALILPMRAYRSWKKRGKE
jgi:BASS family bile acid:Na+ symporter